MKKTFLSIVFLLLGTALLHAQTLRITGRVLEDSTSAGLSNVSVVIAGSNKGVSTDKDGNFTITATGNTATLQVSSIGYKPQTITANGAGPLTIYLSRQAASTADEVVVVGYQTVRRRDLTSSVSSINARQLKDIPINSASQALAGRLAGVQITGSEGSPNADVQIRIRGGGSITQDNAPLYVIDGVQVENGLNAISPQDIESVDVLKDASATAIYGSRGANGVVIITTKRGRNARTVISYNGFAGINKLANELKVMHPYDYAVYVFERANNVGDATGLSHIGTTWDTLANYKNIPFVDWQQQVFGRKALMQTHNVSLAGGTAATQYNLSVTSNIQQGIMQESDYNRNLVTFAFDHNFNDKLKISFNTRFNNTVVNGAGTSNPGSSAVNGLRQAIRYRPYLMAGQDVNTYDAAYASETNSNSLSLVNPVLLNHAQYRNSNAFLINVNGSVSYAFTPYLAFKTTAGYDYTSMRGNAFDDTITYNAKFNGSGLPIASVTTSTRATVTNSNVLTYTNARSGKSFAQKNSIDALVGHEVYENNYKSYYQETRSYPVGTTSAIALGNLGLGIPAPPNSNEYTEKLLSFFSRINYAYNKKYLASVSVRSDGSSKFASGKQWGYFPSGSVAWRISSEPFMDKLKPTLSDLKVRASYGQAGNNRIPNFLYTTQFVPNTYYGLNDVLVSAYNPASLSNPDLKWETTISRNIGVDASFFNNRISLSADFYRNTTRDLLVNVTVPTSSGYTSQVQNVGSTLNTGMEYQLSATPV